MKRALMYATVASMIDLFNMENIKILQNLGYQVDVAANFEEGNVASKKRINEFKKELSEKNINYYHIPIPRSIYDISNLKKSYDMTADLKSKNKYNLVHCHTPIGSAICRLAFKKSKSRVIYTAHGFHFYKGAPLKNWLIFYPIEKYFSRFTDKLITINKEDYEFAQKKLHAKEVFYIPGVGIDLEKFKPISKVEKDKLRSKMGIKKDDFILIQVGELNDNKNQGLLIEAVGLVKDNIPNLKVLLVGQGPLRAEYEMLIENKGLDNIVELLGYRADINDLMSLADLAISTSRREGLPVNILEAMATGLPIIVTDVRGNQDLVKDNKNGYVIPIDDTRKLAKKIKKIYQSKELIDIFSKKNLVDIKSYSLETVLAKTKQVYK